MEYFAVIYAIGLLTLMLVFLEVGRRFGLKRDTKERESGATGKRIIEGAFFGLLSLLLAFSFSGAISRFDHRRELIIQEANDVGTAYLRVDLLPAEAQSRMRQLFQTYIDSRLASYRALPNINAAKQELDRSINMQGQIWTSAVSSCKEAGANVDCGKLLLPALNSMFDTSNSRTWAALTHPPVIIYGVLFLIALICAFLAGNSLADASSVVWPHIVSFALLTSLSMFVALEIEYPRIGFINIEKYDQALIDVRESMR